MSELIFASRFFNLFRFLLLTGPGFVATANAQLCTGSLGDPVVNITFGPGPSTNYSPPGAYIYTSSSCPDDGYYTVTAGTSNCFNNTWHTVSNDHTGNGNFMLVNATVAPGDFFLTTVTDLCPNTTYEFAAWIMNVVKSFTAIQPNITFKIETPGGTILQQFTTGNIGPLSQPTWMQYGFYFTTPATNAAIVLRMTNTAPGGLGNDLALDDITFRPCGPLITANIVNSTSDTIDICEGNNNIYTFNASVGAGFVSPVYRWQLSTDKGITWNDIPGTNNTSYVRQPTAAGNYWYRMSVVESSAAGINACRISSNEVIINVHAKPVVDAGPDRIVLTGNTTTLAGKAEGENIVFSWSPPDHISDTTVLDPIVSPPSDFSYKLTAVSGFGCKNDDEVNVKVVTGIYIPSAFTPNEDGRNDFWTIPFLDPGFDATVSVFNRYGQLVYHTQSAIVSWDGKLNGVKQASGVYVYLITFRASKLKLKGTLTLIR